MYIIILYYERAFRSFVNVVGRTGRAYDMMFTICLPTHAHTGSYYKHNEYISV